MNVKTKDIYEAAYYLMYGAKLLDYEKKLLPPDKRKKKGISKLWIIELSNVPNFIYETWNSGYAYGNIREYAKMRMMLKKFMVRK